MKYFRIHVYLNVFFYLGLLEESVNRLDSSATIKAKLFYKSCMNISKYLTKLF